MEQPIQGAKLVAILSEKFNKDAVWTLTAANALAGATTGEREVIFASSQDRQLLLLDGLVRSEPFAMMICGALRGDVDYSTLVRATIHPGLLHPTPRAWNEQRQVANLHMTPGCSQPRTL